MNFKDPSRARALILAAPIHYFCWRTRSQLSLALFSQLMMSDFYFDGEHPMNPSSHSAAWDQPFPARSSLDMTSYGDFSNSMRFLLFALRVLFYPGCDFAKGDPASTRSSIHNRLSCRSIVAFPRFLEFLSSNLLFFKGFGNWFSRSRCSSGAPVRNVDAPRGSHL